MKNGLCGDSFYIRTHFARQPSNSAGFNKCMTSTLKASELGFVSGDIFHVTDTLAGGVSGYWQVTKVYSAFADQQCDDGNSERATNGELNVKIF